MIMKAESMLLKNGKTCVLRSVEPEDGIAVHPILKHQETGAGREPGIDLAMIVPEDKCIDRSIPARSLKLLAELPERLGFPFEHISLAPCETVAARPAVPQRETDPFTFVMSDHGYQAFLFRPDQVVETNVGLGIVTGWGETMSGWHVRGRVAKGDFYWRAEDLKQAAYPEGLVEILRGKVHTKVDEAFES